MEYLIAQCADDTAICLDGRRESFKNVIKILNEVALWSSLNISHDKSQVTCLGSQKGSRTVFWPHIKLTLAPKYFKSWALPIHLTKKK